MEKTEIVAIYEDMTALHARLSESLDVLDRLLVKLEFRLPDHSGPSNEEESGESDPADRG